MTLVAPASSEQRMTDPEDLWARFSQELRRYIRRRVQRPEDVEDILQTVFLRIQSKLATLRDDDRLLAWIYAVTRNAVIDHYRLANNRRELSVERIPEVFIPPDPRDDEATAEAELAACLRPMIARLPHEQAAALELVGCRAFPK